MWNCGEIYPVLIFRTRAIVSTNPGLTGIILGMYIGDTLLTLLDFIWHINWYSPWIDTLELI